MLIPSIESGTKQEIHAYQSRALKEVLRNAYQHSSFYKKLFDKEGIDPETFNDLDDLAKLPVTEKQDLQADITDFWCVGRDQILDYCVTSGTTGKPVTIPLTRSDIDRLAYNEKISLACANGSNHDIYQLTTTIDRQFMAGYAYALGVRELGAGLIRVGPGLTAHQWELIFALSPTALIVVPSFLLRMLNYAEEHNIEPRKSSISKAICIGEPIRQADFSLNAMGERIRQKWDIELFSTYGISEIAAAFTECGNMAGGHVHPELVIPEIVDEQNQPVAAGEQGELVITTLGVEALPLIRYKTGDITFLIEDECNCGRTTSRIGPIMGRKNQLIKYKGTTCYPPAIFNILDDNQPHIIQYQVVIQADEVGNDEIIVRFSSDGELNMATLKEQFRTSLRVTPQFEKWDPAKLAEEISPNGARKAIKYKDLRVIGN